MVLLYNVVQLFGDILKNRLSVGVSAKSVILGFWGLWQRLTVGILTFCCNFDVCSPMFDIKLVPVPNFAEI